MRFHIRKSNNILKLKFNGSNNEKRVVHVTVRFVRIVRYVDRYWFCDIGEI